MPPVNEIRAVDEATRSPPVEAFDGLAIVVGEIAHDFNNILSLIFGYVEMAMGELPEGSRARGDLQQVLAAGERAKELVSRILTYSNRARLKRGHIGLAAPVQQAADRLSADLPGNVRLTCNVTPSGNRVFSNPAEIYQLVLNLGANALQAMPPEGGEVTVSLDYFDENSDFWRAHQGLKRTDYARIRVRDTGRGMDLGTQEKMYHPFFTTSRGSAGETGRAGLGLTTVYNIVTSHNGMIYVDSAPGRGTCFDICLPVASSGHLPDVVNLNPAREARTPPHILLVDDESAALQMARGVLEAQGYAVSAFRDPAGALDCLEHRGTVDLLITDLLMPSMPGTDLAARARAARPELPIILLGEPGARLTQAGCRQWGVRELLAKPWTPRELLAAIQRCLEKS